jgi:hypothetical protein
MVKRTLVVVQSEAIKRPRTATEVLDAKIMEVIQALRQRPKPWMKAHLNRMSMVLVPGPSLAGQLARTMFVNMMDGYCTQFLTKQDAEIRTLYGPILQTIHQAFAHFARLKGSTVEEFVAFLPNIIRFLSDITIREEHMIGALDVLTNMIRTS